MMRECSKQGCTTLVPYSRGVSRCAIHNASLEYKHQRTDIKEQQFYNSKAWRSVRDKRLRLDNFICQRCIIRQAQTVHHIKHLKECWTLRLTLSNLTSLCESCHQHIHKNAPL